MKLREDMQSHDVVRWKLAADASIARSKKKDFHAHLDTCHQCRNHPFALCHLGVQILQGKVER